MTADSEVEKKKQPNPGPGSDSDGSWRDPGRPGPVSGLRSRSLRRTRAGWALPGGRAATTSGQPLPRATVHSPPRPTTGSGPQR